MAYVDNENCCQIGMALKDGHCNWAEYPGCGSPTNGVSWYCREHANIAYLERRYGKGRLEDHPHPFRLVHNTRLPRQVGWS